MTARADILAFGLGLGLAACSCYVSHEPDVGRTDGGDGTLETGPRDAGIDGPPDPCVTSAGYRRCGGECVLEPGRCGFGHYCDERIGLCLPGVGPYGCMLARDLEPHSVSLSPGCTEGACLYVGNEFPAPGTSSLCVPEEVCLMSDAEIGPHTCFWSDGTEVTRLPPPDPCVDLSPAAECGRVCGPCSGPCLGVSDVRGVGFCEIGGLGFHLCSGEPGDTTDPLLCMGFLSDRPCSCMRPTTPAPSTIERFGFLVHGDMCPRYAALYPGQVECIVIAP